MEYFEDLQIGRIERYGRYKVTREEVLEFAAKYDPQPFHLDDEAAAQTHFGRIAASGWHTCAMVMRMNVDHWAEKGNAGLGSPGLDELRWLRPVYPGDVLTVENELLSKRESKSKPDVGLIRTESRVYNQDGVMVMRHIANGMIRRRPA